MGATGLIVVRVDSVLFSHEITAVSPRAGARFSLIQRKKVRSAIEATPRTP
ncbi:hypothetical protein [Streptomyces incanus]|uniref:Uncharacterized protein n=1 Tax=Streptomyces incanus TaxID=887453 RepID=A0ABW0XWV2_9ACTN